MNNPSIDNTKGKIKEAAGALTDNDDLKNEGKADQTGAKVKETANTLADKVGSAVDKVKQKLTGS